MKKLFLLIAFVTSLNAFAQVRVPFAPAGASWKYWYADEFTTGYVNVTVLTDTVSITGFIAGTTNTITVKCSEIYTPRGMWVGPSSMAVEEPTSDKYNKAEARYMFREGNKAYIYDKYDKKFYKLIDMDAKPGDQWQMSLFNGTVANDFSYFQLTHDPAKGVPTELLPYFAKTSILSITDLNWACNLGNAKFSQFLLANGITQAKIDAWSAQAKCVKTGTASAGKEHPLYTKATNLLTLKGFAWTEATWACDFRYYNDFVKKWTFTEISTADKNTVFALCTTPLGLLVDPFPMPEEIVQLWKKADKYTATDGISTNNDFKLITRYNWPRYIDTPMKTAMMLPVANGGLGLTAEQITAQYTNYSKVIYTDRLVPGEVDLVEVTEKKDVEINGKLIPVVVMGPACKSLLDPKAIRSEVSLNGAFNINYLNLFVEPWPQWLESGSSYEIRYSGLLCANNGTYSLETPLLTDYFKNGLIDKFNAGKVSCSEVSAPKFNVSTKSASILNGDNPFASISNTGNYSLKNGAILATPDSALIVKTVVHVVYNEKNPESKITEAQINEMLASINSAYLGTNNQSGVNKAFTSVIGIPGFKLKLATTDPTGKQTNGIVYHKTEKDYFTVGVGTKAEEKYAFKFDDVGRPYNWDHTRYLNIYIADFNGKNGGSVGGFVTNPEPTGSNDPIYTKWLETSDNTFWKNWLNLTTGDAPMLDGLSVDYYSTFLARELTPDIKYKTAIHELGHYFGLKHTFALVVEKTVYVPNPVKSTIMYGDNIDDTPQQYYKTTVYDNCKREIYQCGNLIQISNFMDYSLPCACMFTEKQSAYMRNFVQALRPKIFSKVDYNVILGTNDISVVAPDVCPNPTSGIVRVFVPSQETFSVYVVSPAGQILSVVNNAFYQTEIDLSGMPSGVYFLRIVSQGKITSSKVVKQ